MKRLFLAAIVVASSTLVFGQSQEPWCGFDTHHDELLNSSEEYREGLEHYLKAIKPAAGASEAGRSEKLIVPTVFHVLWEDCRDNISLAQVEDALRVLNEDINRQNADTFRTRDIFKGVAGAANIEFRLAQLDPSGNPTDGVVRIETPATINASNNVKGLSYWPSNQYFNIWIVRSITSFGGSGTILGYAQFPTGNWNTFGIVQRHDQTGTIGTSNADGRTFSHEVGHCLGLYHTFQSGCGSSCQSSGDGICDTPPSAEATYSCSFTQNTCSGDSLGNSAFDTDVLDQIENYMSYNSCQNMFTQDQAAVMRSVLTNIGYLSNLTSTENLQATGIYGLSKAKFKAEDPFVFVGDTVQLLDQSEYDANSWDWVLPDGFPGNSQDQNPAVQFFEPGPKAIQLTASNGSTSVTDTIDDRLFVVERGGHHVPSLFDFENVSALPDKAWYPQNISKTEYDWKVTTDAAYSGSRSLMLENFGNCGNKTSELITQTMDFSSFTEVEMSFKGAFAQRDANSMDFIRMYISNDLGVNWQLFWVNGGSNLSSVSGFRTSPFTPEDTSEWKSFNVPIQIPDFMTENVMIKMAFVSRGGNHFYIDDVSFNGSFRDTVLLKSPENGATGLASRVLIDWKAVALADYYEYQLDTEPVFTSSNLIAGTKSYIDNTPINDDTEFKTPELQLNTKYYWRVRYVLDTLVSNWSEVRSFWVSPTGVGVEESMLASTKLDVFPNPFSNDLSISASKAIASVDLFSLAGQRVTSAKTLGRLQTNIDTSPMPAGYYILRVEFADGSIENRRVVKALR